MKPFNEFCKFGLIFAMGLLIFSSTGYAKSDAGQQSQLQGYPIDTNIMTTLQRTVVPIPVPSSSPTIFPYQVSSYDEYGYGKWQYGPGTNSGKLFLSTNHSSAAVTQTARLLKCFVITDIHLSDKESPAQGMYFGYCMYSLNW